MLSAKKHFKFDSSGKIMISKKNLWDTQTELARKHFAIGNEIMPEEIIHSLALIKKAAALANHKLGKLSQYKSRLIIKTADEIIVGKLNGHFPLTIWQSGSGTQTNMNINEVIANRANKKLIHPNDDVNMSQSTNDVFPTAMHLTALKMSYDKLLPALKFLHDELSKKQREFSRILKIGRTHLQDAVPITLGEEFSGYAAQIGAAIKNIELALENLKVIPLGGTAVGTGINAPVQFAILAAKYLSQFTKIKFKIAANKFSLMAAHDGLINLSGSLKTLAGALIKIANDIRWMNSGPNCGLGELILPDNEPGSSIMPGKVNPTQCEALTMIGAQIIGNDATISFAGSQGNFELNAFKPVIIYNLLQSINLLSDGCNSFARYALRDLKVNHKRIKYYLENSLMVATLLTPIIGYDKTAAVVKLATQENITWYAACLKLKFLPKNKINDLLRKTR